MIRSVLLSALLLFASCQKSDVDKDFDVNDPTDNTDDEVLIGGDGITSPASMPSEWGDYYEDTIDDYGVDKTWDATDLGVSCFDNQEDALASPQSTAMQTAIEHVATEGGGILTLPAGHYCISGCVMCSNVHIVVDKDAYIYPEWVWSTGEDTPSTKSMFKFSDDDNDDGHIENCSIRCAEYGEYFTVDFLLPNSTCGWQVRFANFQYVKNFMVEGIKIIDNYSVYCAMNMAASARDGSGLQLSENGTIRNCILVGPAGRTGTGLELSDNAGGHPGYGLVQMHSAKNIWCENLIASGGVTVRLETGATDAQGVEGIYGQNIGTINGRSSLMIAPHRQHNGWVMFDNLWGNCSAYVTTVSMSGFDDEKDDDDDDSDDDSESIGSFKGVHLTNIKATYGNWCTQLKSQNIYQVDRNLWQYIFWREWSPNNTSTTSYKWLFGPSIAAIKYNSEEMAMADFSDSVIEGVVTEGYKYNSGGFLDESDSDYIADEDNKFKILAEWESLYLF